MQGQLNLIWEKLLPAMQAAPLPEAPAELEKLQQTLGQLEVRPDHKELVLRPPGER